MNQETKDKWVIYAPILAVVLSLIFSALVNNHMKARSAITQEQAVEMIDEKGEEILDRAEKYTDIRIEAQEAAYEKSIRHVETLLKTNNEMMKSMMESINERLDRIDDRISRNK